MAKQLVVAIDGPAGAGKSSIARRVASALGYLYIDTGAMYRAVALRALRGGVELDDAPRLEELARAAAIELEPGTGRVLMDGEDVTEAIRAPDISSAASKVSALPGVRRALVAKQREMGARGGVVMEGRDIGSVVFPAAEVKIFLDADPAVRSARRHKELADRGEAAEPAEVEREIRERDRRDSTRADSPLVRARDAVYVDSTGLGLDEVEAAILKVVRERARA